MRAITIDFYQTLARHRTGRGRGVRFMEFLAGHGWGSAPWEHQVLYDVFDRHHLEYRPSDGADAIHAYHSAFARRVFDRLQVRAPSADADRHASEIWGILGPPSMELYPDVLEGIGRMRAAGYPLAIVSNWQCGLATFVDYLGIRNAFEHVIASAEVGFAKPDVEIFREAARRLRVPIKNILHIGDSEADDVGGARAAGMSALHLRRGGDPPADRRSVIASLVDVVEHVS